MKRIAPAVVFLGLALAGPAWALFGASKRPEVGAPAPRIRGPLLRGGEFDLGPLLGNRAVLIDFWSIYCVACLQEMPSLIRIYRAYKDKGLEAASINLDGFGTKRVLRFVRGLNYSIPFPILIDKKREAAARYGVSVLPTTVVIDRKGRISYYHVGYSPGDEVKLEQEVRRALGLEP